MANFKFIARVLVLVIFSNTAFAGYQSMRPPPGYSVNPATGRVQQPGWGPSYKPPPGEFYDMTKKQWMTSAQLNTGGRELAVPVAMPIATGLSVALSVASAFSSNPAILLGTAAWALYQAYLSQKNITPKSDGTFTQIQQGIECASDCKTYSISLGNSKSGEMYSVAAVAAWYAATYSTLSPSHEVKITSVSSNSFSGYIYPKTNPDSRMVFDEYPKITATGPYNTGKEIAATPQDVGREMQNLPMSEPLIKALPYPVPVESPIFNPGPDNNPRVMRIPQGSPVAQPLPNPNPENLPQTWKTPVVDVIPAPTTDDPWRVETVPRDITKTSPSPLVDPLNPNAPATPPVTQPETDPGTQTAEKQQSLCEQYPDILACAKPKLDTPDTPTLETKPKDITYAPQSGWGGGGGACPAPRHLNGAKVDFEFTMFCNFMSGIKPIVLAFASLAAGMIIIGARGGAAE